jgi:hypothetical protein
LTHKDNHVRAISAQIFNNLAKSDSENRMLKDFEKVLNVTRDEKFVTARHTLQSIWKIGLVGEKQMTTLLNGLEKRFKECKTEKNYTLIRYDIIVDFKNLYDATKDHLIEQKALELIELEDDEKYKKKYKSAWR